MNIYIGSASAARIMPLLRRLQDARPDLVMPLAQMVTVALIEWLERQLAEAEADKQQAE